MPAAVDISQLPPLPIYRFSPDQFRQMIAAGILAKNEPVQLRDGLILGKADAALNPAIPVASHPDTNGLTVPVLPIRRFTRDEYRLLLQAGILVEGAPAELLDGWIVQKMTLNPPHPVAVGLVEDAVRPSLPPGWHCRTQATVTTDSSEPEPDVAVVRGARRDYLTRHPGPGDTALAIEVADSSLQIDRTYKAGLYAHNGIPVYWIVNLPDRQIEVYTDPTGADPRSEYRQRRDYGPADEVPLVIDGREVAKIPVRDLLP